MDGTDEKDSVTTRATVPPEVLAEAMGEGSPVERAPESGGARGPLLTETGDVDEELLESLSAEAPLDVEEFDAEMTVNLVGDLHLPGRDDLDAPTVNVPAAALAEIDRLLLQRKHLRGLLEALVFASDSPISPKELSKLASAPQKLVREVLGELKLDYATRGMHLDEVAGGWVFRTSPQYAPFVRDLTKQKPVRLTRAQVETLAIIAYRQPITRPEVDEVRGVDSGPVLKLLLERDLVRILGKRDEPGRPLIYGSTSHFLEFFGLKSLKDLPTLREFTELSDESREAFEDELGDAQEGGGEGNEGDATGLDETQEGESEGELIDASAQFEGRAIAGTMPDDDEDDDDLDALEGGESSESSESAEPDETTQSDEADEAARERHASDDDGPTIATEAPKARGD
jgi:segregation and condensation protein B